MWRTAKKYRSGNWQRSFNGAVKEGDPRNWRADISLLRKLGYEKQMELSDGIAAYVDWAKAQD